MAEETYQLKDISRVLFASLLLFVAWWFGNFILPLNDKVNELKNEITRIQERHIHFISDLTRLESELKSVRDSEPKRHEHP